MTASGGSATSGEPFTVTADTGAPTITGLAPGIGLAGTAVTVSGTNFEPTAANNRLALNVTRAAVTSATATTLATTVRPKATTGRFTVVSRATFRAPPAPYTSADVLVTDSMAIGGDKDGDDRDGEQDRPRRLRRDVRRAHQPPDDCGDDRG